MTENWKTRFTLIQRAKDPDNEIAWEEFRKYYHDFIKILLHKLGVKDRDKEDLVQEILISLWKSLPGLDYDQTKGQFRTWMHLIIRRRVMDFYRKHYRQAEKQQKFTEESEIHNNSFKSQIEDMIQAEWEIYLVNEAMKRIAPIFSENAMYAFKKSMENVDADIIAEKLSIKRNSVIKLKNRVKDRMKSEIAILKFEMDPFNEPG